MKRTLSLILILTMLLSLAACGSKDAAPTDDDNAPSQEQGGGRGTPDASGLLEVHRMLASLDEDRREALVLTSVFGFSYVEAAQIVGVAVGTVRSRVARARAQLVAEWSDAVAHLDALRGRLAG